GLEDQDGGQAVVAYEFASFFLGGEGFDTEARCILHVFEDLVGPAALAGQWHGPVTRAGIEVDDDDTCAVVSLLAEAFAQKQAEHDDEEKGHDKKQKRGPGITQQQAEFLGDEGKERHDNSQKAEKSRVKNNGSDLSPQRSQD